MVLKRITQGELEVILRKHTQDINHAVNFRKYKGDNGPCFVEIEEDEQ